MKKIIIFLSFFFSAYLVTAQNTLQCIIKDSLSGEVLTGVTMVLKQSNNAAISDAEGRIVLKNIADGNQIFQLSFIGYKMKEMNFLFPINNPNAPIIILLSSENKDLEEVIVSSTRSNSRLEDLATKIEVLGQEDMDEESTIVPGSVTSILGDLSIITIQKTSPINGNEAIRMQGLDPRYTQIMRDGLPLYGGFSGSLGVLAIPPLDLKQVEIIKGSSSTLYGGGAISGLINFISKTPSDSLLTTVTLNVNTLKETNLNLFSSACRKKLGFTLFAGLNSKSAVDINKDGFTEVPEDQNFSIHPRIFYALNSKNKFVIGYTANLDKRRSGDIQAVQYARDSVHKFLEKENSIRNTVDIAYTSLLNKTNTFSVKAAVSAFQRTSDFNSFHFQGIQNSTYIEASDVYVRKNHSFVLGLNFTKERFKKGTSDSVLFGNYTYSTPGIFLQDDWKIIEKLTLQAGIRYDKHTVFGSFVLPRISLFYKAAQKWSLRWAAGTGYKTPNLFDFSSPSPKLLELNAKLKPEKSYGSNADINFHIWVFDKLSIQIDEAIYYTHIKHPTILFTSTDGFSSLANANYWVNSYGTDTYVRLKYDELELYLGYNHTESQQQNSNQILNMPFNPKDKLSGTLAYELEGAWRMGVEASYTANQYIYYNQRVPNFLFMAAMLERKFKGGSMVLNCENLLDKRQAKYEALVAGTLSNPLFRPVWGPLEGRVINLSVKLNL